MGLFPPGGLGGGCGLDPLSEGCGLAPLPEHLCGLVCDCARGGAVQRGHHGAPHVWDPAVCVTCLLAAGNSLKGWSGVGVWEVCALMSTSWPHVALS